MMHNAVVGKTLRWRFEDGSAVDKTYIHKFNTDGSVDFRAVTGAEHDGMTHVDKCEVARIHEDVSVVSYRGNEGYTLTTVLNFKTGRMVAFASNGKMLEKSHGEFEQIVDDASTDQVAAELAASGSSAR